MSEFRIEKRRSAAELTLSTGAPVHGYFFLAGSSATHAGPERVADLLNSETGFFPFEHVSGSGPDGARTVLYNRTQVVFARLLEQTTEAQQDPGYDVATERRVVILLTNGVTISGSVRVYRPVGRDRLSDYTRSAQTFRYIEAAEETLVVNMEHVVELKEVTA